MPSNLSLSEIPEELFLKPKEEEKEGGLLWLPPLGTHHLVEKIDWLCGMQISKLSMRKGLAWSDEVSRLLEDHKIELDKSPLYNSNTLLIALPKTFKASLALILQSCSWQSENSVYADHIVNTTSLEPSFIQSLYIWPHKGELPSEEVQWIPV